MSSPYLKSVKAKLKTIYPDLIPNFESIAATGQTQAKNRILNIFSLREAVEKLDELNLFKEYIRKIRGSIIYNAVKNSVSFTASESADVIKQLHDLSDVVNNFINLLDQIIQDESPESLDIKLPDVKDFDELSKVARDLHLAFSQILFNEEINGQTKIVNVDNGSIWFNVIVGAMSIQVVAGVVWSAAVVAKKILEFRIMNEQLKSLKVKNESLQDTLLAQKTETDRLISLEAAHIQAENYNANDPENIERVKNSIRIFSELIIKGAEIKPSISAPESVNELYPNYQNLLGIETKVKKIANDGI